MSNRYDVIVIGGGHNGLACGAYLARSGRKVLLLEAGARVGGMAAVREFAPGYSVPACAHLAHMFHPRVVSELQLGAHGLKFHEQPLLTLALADNGEHLRLGNRTVEGASVTAAERAVFTAFMDRLRRFAAILDRVNVSKAPRLVSDDWRDHVALARLGLAVRRLGTDDMRELLRIGAINIYDVVQEELQSPLLKGALAMDAILGTHMGPRSPNSVLTFLHRLSGQHGNSGDGIRTPMVGMTAITSALAAALGQAGGESRIGAEVVRIVVENDRATGVELAGGETLGAATVVSALDPKATFMKLVGARNLDAGFVRSIHNLRARGTNAKLHLALRALPDFRGLQAADCQHRLLVAPGLDQLELAFDACKYGELPESPPLEIMVPSLHDPGLSPEGKHVMSITIQYAPYRLRAGWDGAHLALQERVMAVLEKYAPGIGGLVSASELLTPADLEREFRVSGGQWHHVDLTLDQFLMLRPVPGAAQYATPVDGLFLCAAGTHPGGGVSGLPGRNAARVIIQGRHAS